MKIAIYKLENTSNNWCYIGSSINFEERKRRHLKDLRKNVHHSIVLQKDYNTYGEKVFDFSIIETVNEEYRDISEEWYIISNIPNIYNTRLVPFELSKISREVQSDNVRTWELDELKLVLQLLIYSNKPLKEILNDTSISESIFQHTIIKRNRNQHIIDSDTERLIQKYKSKRKGNKIMKGVFFKSPDGIVYEVTNGMNNFAKEYGLNAGNLSSIKNKNRKSHKGWTLYEQD